MYTGDKSHRITLRLNEKQFNYVRESAELYGVSPSDFLRMVVNFSMTVAENAESEVAGRENDKTDINDKL